MKKLAIAVAVAASIGFFNPASAAGIPVIDVSNLTQTIVTAVESASQTLKQIQQYQTQLQQYENMLQNTAAPAQQIWDDAQTTMTNLRRLTATLDRQKQLLGSVDAYLNKFQDASQYQSSPCYSQAGCTPEQWAAMRESERLGSQAQKQANDALFRGLDRQQDAMQSDAGQLQRLQSSAQGATGQMQAIGYANQLASHQANQLLQIRSLLVSQQNAIATRNQAVADREAKEAASSVQLRMGTFRPSSEQGW
jgi:P-type conjugative transfer protein TrbJ